MERFNAMSRNGKIGAGCAGLIALVLMCGLCSQLLGGGSQPPPTPTPEVQPLVAPVDEVTVEPTATEEPEATATERPSDTPEPTVKPTAIPPTEAPTAVPPTVKPTPNPDEDVDCSEFEGGHSEAQAWWSANRTPDRQNPGGLDGNANGVVCEVDESAPPPPTQPPPPPPAPAARSGPPQGSDCPADLPVKGNINRDDEKIYHVPGSGSYARTVPEECFATAADAEAAGYRAPRN